MKKLITILTSLVLIMCTTVFFTGCDALDKALNDVIEIELLKEENKALNDKISELEKELLYYKFEKSFPNRIITKDCTLSNLNVILSGDGVDGWANSTVWAVLVDNSNVTINDGTFDAGSGATYNIALWAKNNSRVIINNGTFITGNDLNGEANHCVYASGGAIIEINGGTFISNGDSSWLVNCKDNDGIIIISGGTFVGFNPQNCVCEGEGTNFLAPGYTIEESIIDGVHYYKVVEEVVIDDSVNDSAVDEF